MLGREPFACDEPGQSVGESPTAAFGRNWRMTHAQDSDTAGDLQQHLDETLARSAEGSWHCSGYLVRSKGHVVALLRRIESDVTCVVAA